MTRVKFIKIHPGWFIFHLIVDSIIHLALFFKMLETLLSSATPIKFTPSENFTFCVFTLEDVIITLSSVPMYCCNANKKGVLLIMILLCEFEVIYIFCLYSFYELSIYENLHFLALVVLGMLKIGHFWHFLYWLNRMLVQQKVYRIALQRFADEFKVSIETLEENRSGNKPNNSA